MLTCSVNSVMSSNDEADQKITLAITDTKFYAPVVTWSTQDNVKLLKQLKMRIQMHQFLE